MKFPLSPSVHETPFEKEAVAEKKRLFALGSAIVILGDPLSSLVNQKISWNTRKYISTKAPLSLFNIEELNQGKKTSFMLLVEVNIVRHSGGGN